MFDDVEKGYIQFKLAGSGLEATFTVDSIAFSNAAYSQLLVTYHAGNSPTLPNNSFCYVKTLHINGIDLNDLQQELDSRYIRQKLLEEQTIDSPKVVVTGEFEADTYTNLPQTVSTSSTEPSSPKEGDLWWSDNGTGKNEVFAYVKNDDGILEWMPLTSGGSGGATLSPTAPPIADHELGDFWMDPVNSVLYVLIEDPTGAIEWSNTCCDEFMPLDITILPILGSDVGTLPWYKEYLPLDLGKLPILDI